MDKDYQPMETATGGGPCRDSVINQLRNRASKAGREFGNLEHLRSRIDNTPGAAEILDIVQLAIDLRLINTAQRDF